MIPPIKILSFYSKKESKLSHMWNKLRCRWKYKDLFSGKSSTLLHCHILNPRFKDRFVLSDHVRTGWRHPVLQGCPAGLGVLFVVGCCRVVAFLAGSERRIDYFCFGFAWLWVKSWPSPAFLSILGPKISVPWVSSNLSEKDVNGTDLCVSLQTSDVTGIPFAFWLSYGSAIAGNFMKKLFQNSKRAPWKATREREMGRERRHIWVILCLLEKKYLWEGFKIFKESFLCHYAVSVSLCYYPVCNFSNINFIVHI